MPHVIDSHSHVQFPVYNEDREAVVVRAREAGVQMIVVGTQISTSKTAVAAVSRYPDVVLGATAGFHPGHLAAKWHHDKNELKEAEQESFDIGKLAEVAKQKEVVAIGECGLDYYRLATSDPPTPRLRRAGMEQARRAKTWQKEVFLKQIELAKELKKPLVIHCRDAFSDLIELLTTNHYSLATIPGVIHFFSGTKDEARLLMELGFYIAFGGVITFAKEYEEIVKFVSLDKIVLETDAPYVAPAPYRGKRNEPAYIIHTAQKIAEIKGVDYEAVLSATLENTRNLFSL